MPSREDDSPLAKTALRARARRVLVVGAAGLLLLAVAKFFVAGHLLLNYTPSIPRGVYWISPGEVPQRGELVAFPIPESVRQLVHERHYVPASVQLLAKAAVAVGGDHVCIREDQLFINGALAGKVPSSDQEGRPLPRAHVCGYLAPDEIFTRTSHENSFDSRYFGPISRREIRGKLTRLLILDD